jgi:purine-binding chemotaxis protein CheW
MKIMETEATKITDQTIQNTANREGKYLTFSLAGEEYGIGILKVKEIIGLISITPVPQTPSHIKGVINLRGKVIPIVDLRIKFGIEAMDYTERTCIIVVEIASGNHKISMGIVVDSVSEVLNIKAAEIEDTPNFGTRLDTSYILGMAKTAQSVKILLDIDKVMSNKEIEQLAAA